MRVCKRSLTGAVMQNSRERPSSRFDFVFFSNHFFQISPSHRLLMSPPLKLIYTSPTFSLSLSTHFKISILDSSFNPPTLAHLALAAHSPTSPILLLHSIKNADKLDFSNPTRTQMMELMGRSLAREGRIVGVGICEEPTFVGKSRMLLKELGGADFGGRRELSFLLGWDTITRFFAEKYYGNMGIALKEFFEVDGSTLVCARRGDVTEQEEMEFLGRAEVAQWRKEKIEMIDLGLEEDVSSSRVRNIVKNVCQDGVEGEGTDERIRSGLKDLVLEEIIEYIIEKKLYRD